MKGTPTDDRPVLCSKGLDTNCFRPTSGWSRAMALGTLHTSTTRFLQKLEDVSFDVYYGRVSLDFTWEHARLTTSPFRRSWTGSRTSVLNGFEWFCEHGFALRLQALHSASLIFFDSFASLEEARQRLQFLPTSEDLYAWPRRKELQQLTSPSAVALTSCDRWYRCFCFHFLSWTMQFWNKGGCSLVAAEIAEGSLEVKLPTIWTDGKPEVGRVREEKRRKKIWDEKESEDAGARICRKVAKHCVFPMICGTGGSKSRLAKAAGAEPSGQMRDEKVHAVVARSTFRCQNVQSTPGPDHFWKLRCRKSARHCGAKHISKSKCTKHTSVGPLLEVEMSQKCMPFWREAHVEVKMYKTHQCRTTFGSCDLEKVHAVVARSTFPSQNVRSTACSDQFWQLTPLRREAHFEVKMYERHQVQGIFGSWDVETVEAVVARSTFPSQNVQNTPCSEHFWKLRCWKSAGRCGAKHISKSKCEKHHMPRPFLKVQMWFCVAGARDFASCQKWAKEREGLVAFPKSMGGVGHLKRTGKMHFTWQEQYKRHVYQSVRRSGCWFPERGCSLELFENLQSALVRGRQLCTQLSSFEGSLAELLLGKLRSLTELLCFWCCQLRKLRKSLQNCSLLTLSSCNILDISENCCVFKIDRWDEMRWD